MIAGGALDGDAKDRTECGEWSKQVATLCTCLIESLISIIMTTPLDFEVVVLPHRSRCYSAP